MGWKTINGCGHYYKSERERGRVKTTYFGAGESGLLISLLELESMEDALEKDREIIFYCACPNEQTSSSVADEYRAKGFENVRVLKDGVSGWQRAGYNVPTDPSVPPVSIASETANRS